MTVELIIIDMIVIDIIINMIDLVNANRFTWKDINTSGLTLTNIISTNRFTWQALFLQTGLPKQILPALTNLLE